MGLFDRASDAPVDVERLARDVHNALTSLREFIDNKSEDTELNSRKVLAEYEEKVASPRARAVAIATSTDCRSDVMTFDIPKRCGVL